MKEAFLSSGWSELGVNCYHCDTEIFIEHHFLRLVARIKGNEPVYDADSDGIIPSNIAFAVMLFKSADSTSHDHCEVSVDGQFTLDEKKISQQCRIIQDYELSKVFRSRITLALVTLARQKIDGKFS